MGISSSKSSTKPWNPAAVNGAQDFLSGTVRSNQPATQATADLINQGLPGLASKAFGNDPTVQAGQTYAQDVLGGKYLGGGNPYLSGMIDQTDNSVRDQVNSQFGSAGRTGGTQHVQTLGRSLADSENNLRYTDYGNERNAMGQALAAIPGLTASQYAGVEPFLQAAQGGAQIPLLGAQALAQGTAQLQSPWGKTTQTPSLMSSLSNLAGLGMMAFGGGGPFAGLMGGK